jgi:hypothetical protein
MSHTKLFAIWNSMVRRCGDPREKSYGGRGISVCDRWRRSFLNFKDDMGERPTNNHSLGRIDNDKGYEPSNCRWETPIEQNRNRRNSIIYELRGERKTEGEWAASLGITQTALQRRLMHGWPLEKALTTPKTAYGHRNDSTMKRIVPRPQSESRVSFQNYSP